MKTPIPAFTLFDVYAASLAVGLLIIFVLIEVAASRKKKKDIERKRKGGSEQ